MFSCSYERLEKEFWFHLDEREREREREREKSVW
jgi:hypothetical protein